MSSSPSEQGSATQASTEYLTFFIAGEEYAVSLAHVREVIPYDTVTRVPGMPDAVRGVTNLRGSVVPVVDLAIQFRLKETPVTKRTCIVLVESVLDERPIPMGLMTEEVGQVLAIAAGDLLTPPSFGAPVRADYLLGMAPLGKKFALVLDIQRALSPRDLLNGRVPEALAEASTADAAGEVERSSAPAHEPPAALAESGA